MYVAWVYFVALIATIVCTTGACSMFDTRGVALLERPPDAQLKGSISRPDKPFVEGPPGTPYARSSFSATEGHYVIEVRDLLVAPAQQGISVEAMGAGVLEVRDGTGSVMIGNKTMAVSMGATFFVSEGDKIRIESRGGPMILRAHFFKNR